MMGLQDGLTLYHGSYADVEMIKLDYSSDGKDFGKGFYLTTSEIQAQRFVAPSVRRAMRLRKVPKDRNYGYVSIFQYHASARVKTYEFETTDSWWLRFISMNRLGSEARFGDIEKLREILKNDVILGKVANDDTNETISAYLSGIYGEPDSVRAIQFTISELRPDRLTDQLCFRTEKAVGNLERIGGYRYDV